ncbi:hypothetical protein [Terriglobus albidus]|nr:hypothetical protein [Terriglobus albidus]
MLETSSELQRLSMAKFIAAPKMDISKRWHWRDDRSLISFLRSL